MVNFDETFQFHHKDVPELVYTWVPEHEQVQWDEVSSISGHRSERRLSTDYPKRTVEQLVSEGTWVVLHAS